MVEFLVYNEDDAEVKVVSKLQHSKISVSYSNYT
jgi:hypothetical protein